jgi:DNA-binding MarR family transcriptional regulator
MKHGNDTSERFARVEVGKKGGRITVSRMLKSLLNRPAYPRELREQLGIPERTITDNLCFLKDQKLIKQLSDGRYAFIQYEETEQEAVRIVKHLWHNVLNDLRPPDAEEIALELGILTDEAERLAFKTSRHTGWFPPTPEMIEEASTTMGEALVLAARVRDAKSGFESIRIDDLKIKHIAESYLTNHPEMLPVFTKNGQDVGTWPDVTLRYLKRHFQPESRGVWV